VGSAAVIAPGPYDLAIVGAGPSGSIAAITAARAGARALVIAGDADAGRYAVGEVLPPAARRLLESLGALGRLERTDYIETCGSRSAWGAASLHATDFLTTPLGPGLHVDRPAFNRALMTTASACGAMVAVPTELQDVARDGTVWLLTVRGQHGIQVVTARALLDCSGRKAIAARRLGAVRHVDDSLVGIVVWLDSPGNEDRDATLTLESAESGWWYTARLPGQKRVVGFVTDPASNDLSSARTRSGWQALLERTAHMSELGGRHCHVLTGPPEVVSASSTRLDIVSGANWAAAGDAAASFDPLSGQGILTAMLSGRLAARALLSQLAGDGGRALAEYARGWKLVYGEYWNLRKRYYASETRWQASRFWNRRQRSEVLDGAAVTV
jgi:flavin-dependent dehydrogenase